MKRQVSRNTLHDPSVYSNANPDNFLVKQMPTYHPLRSLSPEGYNVIVFPTSKPVAKPPYFPVLVQESVTINQNQAKGRESVGSPWRSSTRRQENLTSEPVNLNRAFLERPNENPHLRMLYENLLQDHDQLQQEHEAMLHSHNLLMDENQQLRNQVGRLNTDLATLQKALTNLENDFNEHRSRKPRAEEATEKLRRSLFNQSTVPDSQSLQKILDERDYFESHYKETLGDLKQLTLDKSRAEQEFGARINTLENQMDNLKKETEEKMLSQPALNAKLREEKMQLDDEINNLRYNQQENIKQIENLQKELQKARLSESRSNKLDEVGLLNQKLQQEMCLRTVLLSAEIERLHMVLADKLTENAKLEEALNAYKNQIAEMQPLKGRSSAFMQVSTTSSQPRFSRFEDQVEEAERPKPVRETKRMSSYERSADGPGELPQNISAEAMNQVFEKKLTALEDKFAAEKADLQKRLNEFESGKMEAESRSVLFMAEIDRLHIMIENISQGYDSKIVLLTQQHTAERAESEKIANEARSRKFDAELRAVMFMTEIDRLQAVNEETDQEFESKIASLTGGFSVEKAEVQRIINEAQSRKVEAETRCILFMAEIDRLQTILEGINKNSDIWKNKYLGLEKDHISQMDTLKALQDANPNLEFEKIKKKSDEYRTRIDDLEKYIRDLQNEMKTLNEKASEDAKEIENWKKKYELLESKSLQDRKSLQAETNYDKERAKELLKSGKSEPIKTQTTESPVAKPPLVESRKMSQLIEKEEQTTMPSKLLKERVKESGFLEGSRNVRATRQNEAIDSSEIAQQKRRESERGELSFRSPIRAQEAETISSTLAGASNTRGRVETRSSLKSYHPQPIHKEDGYLGKRLVGEERDVSPGLEEPESGRRERSQTKRTEESNFLQSKVETRREENKIIEEENFESSSKPNTEEEELTSARIIENDSTAPIRRQEKKKERGSIRDSLPEEKEKSPQQQSRFAEGAVIKAASEPELKAVMLMVEIDRLSQLLAATNAEREKLESFLNYQNAENKRLQESLSLSKTQIKDLHTQIERLQQSAERDRINAQKPFAKKETEKSGFNPKLAPSDERSSNRDDPRPLKKIAEESEVMISSYLEEIERLKRDLNDQEKEIVELANERENLAEELGRVKKALAELEDKRRKDASDQRMFLEAQMEKQHRREIAKIQEEHENEIKRFENELRHRKVRENQLEEKI